MKNILITGSTGGIGEITAKYLCKNGYNCVLLGRSEKILKELSQVLNGAQYIVYDLNNLKDIENIFTCISNKNIKLDGLVHCAGISPLLKVEENDISVMQNTFNINLFSFIELAKYFIQEKYSNENASIVAISSVVAKVASYRQTLYASSKAGLEVAVKCMSKEFMCRKIRVNCIEPGAVRTQMLEKLTKESASLKEKFEKLYPLGLIEPDNIAEIVGFLLSTKAKYMTGSCITADSGFLSWK